MNSVIHTTAPDISGAVIKKQLGIISEDFVMGANTHKNIFTALGDLFRGRRGGYEQQVAAARLEILNRLDKKAVECGANAIISIRFSYSVLGSQRHHLLVSASGTAVEIE